MFIRKLALVVATAALGLLAVGIGSASATTLRADPGNTSFPTANVRITNTTSDTSTLTTSLGNIDCTTTSFTADINNNHATNLTGRLTALTFTSCSDTIPVIAITSCHLHVGPIPTVTLMSTSATTASVVLSDLVVRCNVAGSASACYFTAATANGTANNPNSSIIFHNVGAVLVTTPDSLPQGICPTDGTFSTTLTHIVEEGTNRTVTVSP